MASSSPRDRDSERFRRDPTALGSDGPGVDPAVALPALACLRYDQHDEPARWARAALLLAQHPQQVGLDLAVAAVAGDVAALHHHLAADPSSVHREVGPFRWPALLYVVYSRMPQVDAVASARLLLDAGADPDSGYLWRGNIPAFTALTGCFGEGEMGPGRQPRHPQWRALGLLLLERGADPNDGQTLYNRMFTRDDSHLQLLFEHGLGRPSSEVWARRTRVVGETVPQMMSRQVHWAHDHGFDNRVALLARHGFVREAVAHPNTPLPPIHRAATGEAVRFAVADGADVDAQHEGRTALHQAALTGDLELVTALIEAGADQSLVDRDHGTTAFEWAQWARSDAAAELLSDPPHYGGAHDDP